jgi:hypothetical protein
VIHATNAWNPTGHNLLPVTGTRLFYVHLAALSGDRTAVFLGDQHHLTYVLDVEGTLDPSSLRQLCLEQAGLYPHQVDASP